MKLKKESEKNHNKKEKGITLVALVITVVIMLILAAIAISSVTGDGLFNRTREAAETYENASKKESEQMQELMNKIDEYLTEENDNEGVDPGEVAVLGDFVNYSVVVDGVTYDKWRILDFDNNGHMEIVCYNGPSFTMSGKGDYVNAIKILNDKSVPYAEGIYGESTRHLGSDPSNPSSYETINTSYVKYYSNSSNISSNANYRYIAQAHYESDQEAIQSFSNTVEGKKLAGNTYGCSWLASRYAATGSSSSSFGVLYVDSSNDRNGYSMCTVYSSGSEYSSSYSYALAPIVSLESGVKIDTSTAGNGSEGSPWTLTK